MQPDPHVVVLVESRIIPVALLYPQKILCRLPDPKKILLALRLIWVAVRFLNRKNFRGTTSIKVRHTSWVI